MKKEDIHLWDVRRIFEMVSMVSLAAAIGVPLQSPDRGLLPAVIIATIVVVTQQAIAKKLQRMKNLKY